MFSDFNYSFFNTPKDESRFESGWEMHEKSPDSCLNSGLEPDEARQGIWCLRCAVNFPVLDDLRQHILKRHQVIKFFSHRYRNYKVKSDNLKCFQCSEYFLTSKDLNRHVEVKHFVASYDCDICDSKCSRKDRHLKHMRVKHRDERYAPLYQLRVSCKECGERFDCGKSLDRHMKIHAAVTKMECSKCNSVFASKWSYQTHIDNSLRDGADKFPCEQCLVSFCTETLYRKHMDAEHDSGIGKLKCERCIMYFDVESQLTAHKTRVHGMEALKCNHCDSLFWKKSSFRQHFREHLRFPKEYSCEECEERFSSGESLRIHLAIHKVKVKETFECGKCMKVFSLKKNYTRHVENSLKDGIDKHTCDECQKAFCTKSSLAKHLESEHKGGGDDGNESLKIHAVNVLPPEEFKCDICLKSFARIDYLRRHKVNHRASDNLLINYKCNLCDSQFSWKTNYQRHMKGIYKADGRVKNRCEICGKDLCTSKLLKAHTDLEHFKLMN